MSQRYVFFTHVSEYLAHYFVLIHLLSWENAQRAEGLVFKNKLYINPLVKHVAPLCYFWFDSARGT